MEIINSKIAGIFSYPDAKEPLKAMKPGDSFMLEFEPTNPHDPNAIAVYIPAPSGKIKVGYIPRAINIRLKHAVINSVKKGDKFDAITVEVA